MIWIRVDSDFDRHPKVLKLRRLLNEPLAEAWIQRLWRWALVHAPGGDLAEFDAADLAAAVQYPGDPDTLIAALTGAGFLDADPLRVHDWSDHSGQYEIRNAGGRARKARYRERLRDAAETRRGRGGDAKGTATEREGTPADLDLDLDLERDPTLLPDPTHDRLTAKTASIDRGGSENQERRPEGSPELTVTGNPGPPEGQDKGGAAIASGRAGSVSRRGRPVKVRPAKVDPEAFGRFWSLYPRKVGKGQAERAWAKATAGMTPDDLEAFTVAAVFAVARDRRTRQWAESMADPADPCGKIPHPATWLNGRRWEDAPPAPVAVRRLGDRDPEAAAKDDPAMDRKMKAARAWKFYCDDLDAGIEGELMAFKAAATATPDDPTSMTDAARARFIEAYAAMLAPQMVTS